jgi:uncharacterized cupredoxin-like copper-binding protein
MVRWLVIPLAVGLLAACGSDDGEEQATGGAGAEVEVSLVDGGLEPTGFELDPGTYTFRVVNDGTTVHALEIEGPEGEVETGDLEPGDSADLTVELSEAGEYELYCPVGDHREQGMEGTIVVGGGGTGTPTDDETTTEEDSGYRY